MKSQLIVYPEFDTRIERDYLYHVSVSQGGRTERIPVYNHTEDSRVNRNPVDDRRADEYRRFATFAFEGEAVRVDIRVNRDFHDYSVIPAAKKFKHDFRNGVISVYLERPDYFVIRLDGKDHTILSVFADAPEAPPPTADEKTIVVGRWHEVGGGILKITEPNTTVYIPAGSVLNARVQILADHCKIIGRGAIVDPVGDIYRYNAEKLDTGVVLLVQNANHTVIDGIHLLNAKAFNVEFIGVWEKSWAVDNQIRNTKILATQMCTDGITFCYYTKESYAEHCFVYCGDNALVYEEGAHYKDITVGTTCNAIFPQTDVVNSSVEDANVFRADEGIINCEYCGENGITKLENHSIRNLCAADVTYTPYFLYTEIPTANPVVTTGEGLVIENVWLSELSKTKTSDFYQNIAAGDYRITLKNLSIGGKLIREFTPETVGGRVSYGAHAFTYQADAPFESNLQPNNRVVSYQNDVNVFVGAFSVYFEHPILKEKDRILLPAEQLQKELRTEQMATTVMRNGVQYVNVYDLVESGMAKSVCVEDRRVRIVPNDNAENLLLPDFGIVSKYTEYICYASHLLTLCEGEERIYRVINTHKHKDIGIFRMLNEEIKKYGEGVYRLAFEARSAGACNLKAAFHNGAGVLSDADFEIVTDWQACFAEVQISPNDLSDPKLSMVIGGGNMFAIDAFDVKNIRLFKTR